MPSHIDLPLAPDIRVGEIVASLGGDLHGDPELQIVRIAPLEVAVAGDLSFLSFARFAHHLGSTQASCVIVAPDMLARAQSAGVKSQIGTPEPYLYFARLTQWWRAKHLAASSEPLQHPSAVIHPTARVHASARVGALCVVGAGSTVGEHSVLHPRVSVANDCHIGKRCIVHSGAVIGADGFGFAPRADGSWEKIEQLGRVCIGDDVEIGANSCIDRGALQDTTIEDGVKLDNLVQIGHNVRVGAHTAMAGCVGVAGSAVIGRHCTVGGGAVILGHLSLADRVNVSASTTVMRSITQPGTYSGVFPIDDNATWEKNAVLVRNLSTLRARLKRLEQAVASLPTPTEHSPLD